jgi:hypothetical protein
LSASEANKNTTAAAFQRPSLLQSDPPYHRILRGVIASASNPMIIARLEPHIENVANETLNQVIEKGRMDLIDDLASPVVLSRFYLLQRHIRGRNYYRNNLFHSAQTNLNANKSSKVHYLHG